MLMDCVVASRRSIGRIAALLVGSLALTAHAQSTAVIPPAAESDSGNAEADPRPLGDAPPSVYQVMYDPSLLAAIPRGSVITGLQIRQNNPPIPIANWPAAPLTIARYDITMGSSDRTPATRSTTFAENLRNPVLVRSGPLDLAAGAYPGGPIGPTPKPFGPLIPFATGYVYNGGPLVIQFRVSNPSATAGNFAALYVVPGQMGEVAASDSADAAVGSESYDNSGLVVRLTFTPPPTDLAKGVTKVTVGDTFVSALGSIGSSTPLREFPRTQVSVINADQFDTIGPGSDFVGMSHRLNGSSPAWPMAAATFARYSVDLSRSSADPGSLSTTVASNVGADSVSVRSGPLTIPIGALKQRASQASAPFSWEIPFAQPYSYRGGPLLTLLSHSGQSGSTSDLVDAESSPANGYGTVFQTLLATSENAAVTTITNPFPITRYSVDAGTSSPLNQPYPAPGGFPADLNQRLQFVIAASELRYIPVGSVIDSLWLRQRAAELLAAPDVDSSALDFEISLSTASRSPEDMSNVFADNQGADLVMVHDGPLGIAAGSLPPGEGIFGKIAQFRRQFIYKGGPLCIDIRHSGLSTPIGTLNAVQNTMFTNRIVTSSNPDAVAGTFFGGNYTGITVKLGYTPSVQAPNVLANIGSIADWFVAQQPAYAFQIIVPASELSTVDVGSAITGMSFRRATSQSNDPTPFPAADTTVPRFDVVLSDTTRSTFTMSSIFAENIGMGEVLTRSGPLTIPANAFPAVGVAGQPNDNAWYINFDRGYVYQGGDLCVTVRGVGSFTGSGLLEGTTFAPSAVGAAVYNYGDADAASGFFYGPPAVRFAFTPRAFCPADLNNDGVVDDLDFQAFASAYNILVCNEISMPAGCPSDLDYSGFVDDLDFQIFAVAYNELLCP
ncbi:MAG TPA: hypothetical protein VF777_10670 [Phycisphaerales bacterium]